MLILTKSEAMSFVRARSELFSSGAERNPFCSPQWFLHFLDRIAEDYWKIMVPLADGDGASLMMLYSDGGKRSKLSALTNYYASLYSPVVGRASDAASAADSLVRQIDDFRPRIPAVDLSPMYANSPEVVSVRSAFAEVGWYTRQYFCFGNWYLPCEGVTFSEFMEARDSRLYNTWVRKAKKFRPGSGARIELVTEASDVERAMDAYDAVYAKSWKQPEPYVNFVRGWARICAREGWLRLGLAWLGDKPIGAQFWFTVNRRSYIFKLAYDEEHAKLSAGTVLSAELFRHSMEVDKVCEIDYLTGDDVYKRSWMSQRRERTGLIACNPTTPAGFLLMAREAAGELRQLMMRSSRTPATGAEAEVLSAEEMRVNGAAT